jgi:hypothetical protein
MDNIEEEFDDKLSHAIEYCINLLSTTYLCLIHLENQKNISQENYKNNILFKPTDPTAKFFCCICNEGCNENPSTIIGCGHEYHVKCIKQWHKISSECPLCRMVLKPRKIILRIE